MNKKEYLNNTNAKLGRNCFLFGDIINDSFMTENAGYDTQIKIGFRNTENENFGDFLKAYDIVIEGDGNFVVPEFLLRVALNQTVEYDLL